MTAKLTNCKTDFNKLNLKNKTARFLRHKTTNKKITIPLSIDVTCLICKTAKLQSWINFQ